MKLQFNAAGIFLVAYQLLLLVLLPFYLSHAQQLGLWLVMLSLVALCGIGVTALYHRYYSHRTYGLHPVAEGVMLFFATLAMQGSALNWAHDHRLHHRFVDTERDPYSIKKGFWYAHFLWMFEKRSFDSGVVHDLLKNRLLVLQDKYYLPLVILTNALAVGLSGWLFQDYAGAFVLVFLLRLFISHHTTWFINSLAHTWGARPYSREHSAVNNWILSLLTYGEGYHNYHHTFATDYRNGTRWYHFDPTKLLIWSMSKVGLASGLRTMDRTLIARRLLLEDKRLLLDKVQQINAPHIEHEIHHRADALSEKLLEFRRTFDVWRTLRQERARGARDARKQVQLLRRTLRGELRAWGRFCDQVLRS